MPWVGTTDLTGCGDFSADQINIFALLPEPIAHAMPSLARRENSLEEFVRHTVER